ncbi:MAG: MFS transporter [Saprospiraceae bacterium]
MNNLRLMFQNPATRTIAFVFFIHALMFGGWVARIPDVKAQLNISEGELGIALLAMAIGGLCLMPFVPTLLRKYGTGKITFITTFLYPIFFIFPPFATDLYLLFGALLFTGALAFANDVAMNAAAAALEKEEQLTIMSACHGMFSLGGVVGAVIGSLVAGWQIDPATHLLVAGFITVGLAYALKNQILIFPESETEEESFTLPKLRVLGIGIIAFCIMLGEGAVADWSAVYLRETLNSSLFLAGLGFAGFCAAMTLGRFFGDTIVPKLGASRVVSLGSLLGAIGLLLAVLVTSPWVAILGFTLVGIGFSCVVPILFRAAANIPGLASGTGVASVTTAGIIGFLSGPPLLGLLAEQHGLQISLGFVAVLALLGFFLALRVKL